MTRSASRYLGWSLSLALLLMLAGALLVWLANRERQTTRSEFDQATKSYRELRERYQRTAQDETTIRQTIGRFETLGSQGLIGPENRLDWADRLRAIRAARQLPQLEFELAPQRVLQQLDAHAEYSLAASEMKLHAGLLHEGDFLRLMADLRDSHGALVVPRSCDIERSATAAATADTPTATLQANCTLDWITIQQSTPPSATAHTP